jgi:hypothetical protein
MTELAELKKIWEVKQRQVGALRLQSSEGDCVPTTVINALLYLTEDRIHPKLQRLIWSVALDYQGKTTGYVGCQLMSDVINAWHLHAANDRVNSIFNFKSRIATGTDAVLIGEVQETIASNGVACLTCKNGKHYALLHSFDDDYFYGFDPFFSRIKRKNPFHSAYVNDASGMVNFSITKDGLKELFKDGVNQWVHLIECSKK